MREIQVVSTARAIGIFILGLLASVTAIPIAQGDSVCGAGQVNCPCFCTAQIVQDCTGSSDSSVDEMMSRMSVTIKWLQCRDKRTGWDRVFSVEGPNYSSLTGEWEVFDCNKIVYLGPQIKGDKKM